MAKFEQDAADFRADLQLLGILPAGASTIAKAVGLSQSHVANLLNEAKRYTPGVRTKLGELIAAKGNGPVAQSVVDEADDATEPGGSIHTKHERRYRVHGRVVRHEEIIFTEVATFASPVAASEYADWLNDQIERGKEAD